MKYFSIVFILFLSACSSTSKQANDISLCETGWFYSNMGKLNEAEVLFNKCIETGDLNNDSLARTYRNLGINFKRKGVLYKNSLNSNHFFEESLAYYDKIIAMDRNDVYMDYVNKGNTYSEMNKYGLAMSEYNKSFDSYPDYNEAHYNKGIVYEKLGDIEYAKKEFILAYKNGLRTNKLLNRIYYHELSTDKLMD